MVFVSKYPTYLGSFFQSNGGHLPDLPPTNGRYGPLRATPGRYGPLRAATGRYGPLRRHLGGVIVGGWMYGSQVDQSRLSMSTCGV